MHCLGDLDHCNYQILFFTVKCSNIGHRTQCFFFSGAYDWIIDKV
jgi:hypothetical protein